MKFIKINLPSWISCFSSLFRKKEIELSELTHTQTVERFSLA